MKLMPNNYWLEQENKFKEAINGIEIPNKTLDMVDNLLIKHSNDLDAVPSGGGCYWIWTNEPIKHTLHRHTIPDGFCGGEIIYNGIAQGEVKGRIVHHLFGDVNAVWSGLSIDIYTNSSTSHRKKACSPSGKVPYINNRPITNTELLLQLNLSEGEKHYIEHNNLPTYFFRSLVKNHKFFLKR
jgi:hypothetical protein